MSDVSIEDLIKAATSDEAVADPRNEHERFLYSVNAKVGGSWVPAEVIYWKYVLWCRSLKRPYITRYVFFKGLCKLFPYKNRGILGRCYQVDCKTFNITQKEYWEMRSFFREDKGMYSWRRRKSKLYEKLKKDQHSLKDSNLESNKST